jgi:PIN domain-containing protein
VVVAALSSWHEQHEAAAQALAPVVALPAHVFIESYSVLTRLPSGLAVPPWAAADVLLRRFGDPPLRLSDAEQAELPGTLAAASVAGGSTYDGLIALEARAHGQPLLTLDRRAEATYRRLGVDFVAISA